MSTSPDSISYTDKTARLLGPTDGTLTVTNATDYGADPTGTTDSAPAIQSALAGGNNVFLPQGTYIVRSQLVVGNGQTLLGSGRGLTTISIDQTFDPNATGVLSLTGRELLGPTVRDLAIIFQQPSTQGSRSNFKTLLQGGTSVSGGTGIMYPAAIYITSANRFRIERIHIGGAWDGIVNAAGNSTGGWFLNDLEVGALNNGLVLDQTFDFGHLKGYHFWNFDMPGSIINVYRDGNTYAARFGLNGEIDGCNVLDFTTFQGRVTIDNANTWMNFAGLSLDGNNSTLRINNNTWLQITGCYATGAAIGSNTDHQIEHINGNSIIFNYHTGSSQTSVNVTGGALQLIGGQISPQGPSAPIFSVSNGAGLAVQNMWFHVNNSQTWTAPVVDATGATQFVFTGNTFNGASGGNIGNTVLGLPSDNANHNISGNNFNGWGYSPPIGALGTYGPNNTGPVALNGAAGTYRRLAFNSAGSLRWTVQANNDAESGSNAGSTFAISRFNDSGVSIDQPITIDRPVGNVNCTNGTISPIFYATNTSGPTITGGSGAPTSTQPKGSIYMRSDGGAGTRLYVSAGSGSWTGVAGV